jgi:hypothetical protein
MSALPQPSHGEDSTGYQETPSMILPAAPPPELDAAMAAAAQRAGVLAASDRELNFVVDQNGELRVEMRDLAGNVVKTLSPTQAISIMGGLHQV